MLLPRRGFGLVGRLIFLPPRLVIRVSWWLIKFLFRRLRWLLRKFRKPQGPLDLTIEQIDCMGTGDGRAFEDYIANLYRAQGLEAYTTTELREMGKLPLSVMNQSGVGEQGVDVVVFVKTAEGKKKIIIQCKHYSSNVGNKAVQEITSAMRLYEAHKAVVITNRYFTKPAKNLALANDVLLIGRNELPNLVKTAVNFHKKKVA